MAASGPVSADRPPPPITPLNEKQLEQYMRRICAEDATSSAPTHALLHQVVYGHSLAISFENFAILLKKTPKIDITSLVDKLVLSLRGGYCFETVSLLAAALVALGFQVALRQARVWARAASYNPAQPDLPRTHMCIVVRATDDSGVEHEYLCDTGFGGGGPSMPLPLRAGEEFPTPQGETYRFQRGSDAAWEDHWLLEALVEGEWKKLYSFEHYGPDQPRVRHVDFEPTNFYIGNLREGLFADMRFATKPNATGRATLLGNELKLRRAGVPGWESTMLGGAEELHRALREHFGLGLTLEEAAYIFEANEKKLSSFEAPPHRSA